MLEEIKAEVTRILLTVQIKSEQQVEAIAETRATTGERTISARGIRGGAGRGQFQGRG
jgi:preprotein translocase subunit SecA